MKVGATTVKSFGYDAAGRTTSITTSAGTTFEGGDNEHTNRVETRSAQSITGTRAYDAFGNLESITGSPVGALGFCGGWGYQEDSDSGLKLLGHRYYDASTGHFLNRDQSKDGRDWYAYCDNSPTRLTDPNGNQDTPEEDMAELAADALDNAGRDGTTNLDPETIIIRTGGRTEANLTPKPKDISDGLSMTTRATKGVSFRVGDVTKQGFNVINDHADHVAVSPADGSLPEWIGVGEKSIWTGKLALLAGIVSPPFLVFLYFHNRH